MNLSKMAPIVTTDKLPEVKSFYLKYFDFTITFEHESYLGFKDPNNTSIEIGFMPPKGEEPIFNGKGFLLGMEVEDVDLEYARLRDKGISFERTIQDNPWGDRSFLVRDPAGTGIYIYMPIPPSEEFLSSVKG